MVVEQFVAWRHVSLVDLAAFGTMFIGGGRKKRLLILTLTDIA